MLSGLFTAVIQCPASTSVETAIAISQLIMMPEQDGIGLMPQMLREWRGMKIIAIPGGGRVDKSDYFGVTQKLGAIAASDKSETDALAEMLETLLKRRPGMCRNPPRLT